MRLRGRIIFYRFLSNIFFKDIPLSTVTKEIEERERDNFQSSS